MMQQGMSPSDAVSFAARESAGLEAFRGGDAVVSLLVLVLLIACIYYLVDGHGPGHGHH